MTHASVEPPRTPAWPTGWPEPFTATPGPLLAVTDAAILASRADAVLLVLESGRTPKVDAQKALGYMKSTRARVLGAVLNQSKDRRAGYYYYESQPRNQFLRWWMLGGQQVQALRERVKLKALTANRRRKKVSWIETEDHAEGQG